MAYFDIFLIIDIIITIIMGIKLSSLHLYVHHFKADGVNEFNPPPSSC
uniref:Uncharacterized protein n=1 Tax=Lepeophtheirus salmonis TaxID=72036 RepID=A0A0K2TVP9_LEPSM